MYYGELENRELGVIEQESDSAKLLRNGAYDVTSSHKKTRRSQRFSSLYGER